MSRLWYLKRLSKNTVKTKFKDFGKVGKISIDLNIGTKE